MDTDEAIESARINGVSLLSLLKGILSPVTKKTLKHGLKVVIQIIPISLILAKQVLQTPLLKMLMALGPQGYSKPSLEFVLSY